MQICFHPQARTTERENIKRTNSSGTVAGESLEPALTSTLMRLNVTNIWRPSSNASKHLVSKHKLNYIGNTSQYGCFDAQLYAGSNDLISSIEH